jgi:2-polyprenyl-3-methyl-5-hydroxy-6-metoxy-1,4-benzoquinol methylase
MSQPAPEDKRCDLCLGSEFELIGRLDRKGAELLTDICTGCGLVSHRKIPTEEQLAEFYARDYRRQYHGEATPSARRVMRAWKNGQRIYSQLAAWLAPHSDVFEVGAGIGCTVKHFERQGHAAGGIEPNQGFQAFAQRRLRARVSGGFLFDLPAAPRHDCMLLIHVIEHLRSPRAALEHLHAMLRPEGLLYVECPNLGAPFATRSRLFHFAHIYNFAPLTLAALARSCGFEPVQWFTRPSDPDLQVLLRRVGNCRLEIDPQSYRATKAAIARYNPFTYHLRWRYLQTRAKKLAGYIDEHLRAERFVRRLLGEVQPRLLPTRPQLRVERAAA